MHVGLLLPEKRYSVSPIHTHPLPAPLLNQKSKQNYTQQVTLMPQEGESFAGAIDSLEARCRLETRALYESEGKEELLGESGVPESLRVWLEESRERALNEGGYRQGARTRLRGQVGGANNS